MHRDDTNAVASIDEIVQGCSVHVILYMFRAAADRLALLRRLQLQSSQEVAHALHRPHNLLVQCAPGPQAHQNYEPPPHNALEDGEIFEGAGRPG